MRIISMRSSCSRAFRRSAAMLDALRSSSPPSNGELDDGGKSPLVTPVLLLAVMVGGIGGLVPVLAGALEGLIEGATPGCAACGCKRRNSFISWARR